ncbi:MAG: CDP-glucose 4,6-dehydratase [Candidatus Pseudoruminococcus sp.]|uniref:CDP-glucose 4,6-dehydratase n=1 Tax=Candidatus Pseudoruminococcus sp. TaxID=3101048 RepID=UPI002A7E18A1|nr:CDP-glucose 4,6-dehydratase [Ruminococcus sp.]MDY2783563.1 CDP-glucose 4,6-dehydratase [Candidatus Pseudoruminococcus sp.]
MIYNFYKGKNVFVTGNTGFKGSWLCRMLLLLGANVTGYALPPSEENKLFSLSQVEKDINAIYGDIRDFDSLKKAFDEAKPDIVFHLAAQPLVLEGYKNPAYTYETNVMGTVNILECARLSGIGSLVNVTTDKVYKNNEWEWGYRENDELGGYDPYSNSKSCSEMVTACYIRSFFDENSIPVSTARAGNVIGGGDFAENRIIPDCFRAASCGKPIIVRNPYSVRPYQHVIEPLYAYLEIARRQYEDKSLAGNYNVGPNNESYVSTGELVNLFCKYWQASWCSNKTENAPHEAGLLKLDCSRIKTRLGIEPQWDIDTAVRKTTLWYLTFFSDPSECMSVMNKQIEEYFDNIKREAK